MSSPTESNDATKVSTLNIANVVAFTLNVVITYGIGVAGIFPSLPDNGELSAKYQTLITPASLAFSIWGVIFISEFIFTVAQVFARYRATDLVVTGVGYKFVAACIAQAVWTISFALEVVTVSLIAMVSILVPLVLIVQASFTMNTDTNVDYWLLKFPFQIHLGWIMAATFLNANVLLVFLELSAGIQIIAAWASLACIILVAAYYVAQRIWVVPCVLAWASYFIYAELQEPRDSIVDRFADDDISFVRTASLVLSITILTGVALRLAVDCFTKPKTDEEAHNSYVSSSV